MVATIRTLALKRRWLAVTIVMAALAMRFLVPAGFMPVFAGGEVSLALCSGFGPVLGSPPARQEPMSAMVHGSMDHAHDQGGDGHQVGSPCAYADLSIPALGGADPLLVAAMLAFAAVLALLRAPLPLPSRAQRLQPPSRGPPLPA